MNNYEKIKSMSLEEMAAFIDLIDKDCQCCASNRTSNGICRASGTCESGVSKWLKSEAEE